MLVAAARSDRHGEGGREPRRLSGGRLLLGVGAGWNEEEMEDHGVDPARRFGRMRESVEAMRALWTQDVASYDGEHVAFAPSWSWPKPLQPGGPPVLRRRQRQARAGARRRLRRRLVSELPGRRRQDDRPRSRSCARWARRPGRGPLPTTLQVAPQEPERLARFEQAGVTRIVWYLPPRDRAADRARARPLRGGRRGVPQRRRARAGRRRSRARARAARSAPTSPGPTSMCCVATWTSRWRRWSGLDA